MKTRILTMMVILVFAVGTAGLVVAGVNDGNHNMAVHDNDTSGAGVCSYCHIPHGAQGDRLFSGWIDPGATVTSSWTSGDTSVTQMCWQCHGATGYYNAPNYNVFQDVSSGGTHGRDATLLESWGDVAALSNTVQGIHAYSVVADTIACTSCHDVHSNTERPFLRNNGINGGSGGTAVDDGDFTTLCDDCHSGRFQNAGSGTRQNHPADNVTLADTTGADIVTYVAGGAFVSPRLQSRWPNLAVEMTTNATIGQNPNDHWNLGGKFTNTTNAAGFGDQTFNCGTCHLVHSNELAAGSSTPGDGLDGATDGITSAVNWSTGNALTAYNMNASAATPEVEICYACHDIAGDGETGRGPGLGATYSHPWATASLNAPFDSATALANGAHWGVDAPGSKALNCRSCHETHFARLTETAGGGPLLDNGCQDCHTSALYADHHPTDVTVTFSGATQNIRDNGSNAAPYVGQAVYWSQVTPAVIMSSDPTTGWVAWGTTQYVFPGGQMTCATCHASGAAGAHNNLNPGVPAAGTVAGDVMCVDCHGLNPSLYTQHNTVTAGGSHYLGAIDAAKGYDWAYGDSTAAQNSVTTTSGAIPSYYTSGGTDYLICTSCHVVQTNGLTLANMQSDNTGDNENSTVDNVRLLLSTSGNNRTDGSGSDGDFLCTACHGAAPSTDDGTGATHYVQPTNAAAGAAEIGSNAAAANNFVTHIGANTSGSSNGPINCESCHRPHDADVDAGTLILEVAETATGYIDESVLCDACHGGYR